MTKQKDLSLYHFMQQELDGVYTPSEVRIISRMVLEGIPKTASTGITVCKINQLSELSRRKLQEIIARLKAGEPVQYVLGATEFYGLPFHVAPGVLIPRPETEELVDWILKENTLSRPVVLDVGTGSGCIAVTLAKKIPGSRVDAWDISPKALEITVLNAKKNGVQVHAIHQDVFEEAKPGRMYDIIVSNPPYVLESDKEEMEVNVLAFEPHEALFVPDHDPLIYYKRIVDIALARLGVGGHLYVEIHRDKGEDVCTLLAGKGFRQITLRNDISGNPRMVSAIRG